MDRVARLKADDASPASLGERGAGVRRVERELGKRRGDTLEDGDAARDVEIGLVVHARNSRMSHVRGTEGLLSLPSFVVLVDLLDVEDAIRPTLLVGECDAIALGCKDGRQTNRKRPREAGREPHRLENRFVVLLAHEALERRQGARREHVEIGQLARRERERLQRVEIVRPFPAAIDELTAMGCDQTRVRTDDHAATRSGTRPSSSRTSTMRSALSAGSSCSDSMRSSGFAGAS